MISVSSIPQCYMQRPCKMLGHNINNAFQYVQLVRTKWLVSECCQEKNDRLKEISEANKYFFSVVKALYTLKEATLSKQNTTEDTKKVK